MNSTNLYLSGPEVVALSARGLRGEAAKSARAHAQQQLSHAAPTHIFGNPETRFPINLPEVVTALGDGTRYLELVDPQQRVSLSQLSDVTNMTRTQLLQVLEGDKPMLSALGRTRDNDRVYHLSDVAKRFKSLKLPTGALTPDAIKAFGELAPMPASPAQVGSMKAIEGAKTIGQLAIGPGSGTSGTVAMHVFSSEVTTAGARSMTPIPVLRAEPSVLVKAVAKVHHAPLLGAAFLAPIAGAIVANTAASAVDMPQSVRVAADVAGVGLGIAGGLKLAKMSGGGGRPAAAMMAITGTVSGLGSLLSWREQ